MLEQDLCQRFDTAVFLIAAGLREKDLLHDANPNRYPYSNDFRHGLNMYAALCAQYGTANAIAELADLSETKFVRNYCTIDVFDWTVRWKDEARQSLSTCDSAKLGPLAFAEGMTIIPSDECLDHIVKAEADTLGAYQERNVYNYLKDGTQEHYVVGRRFLIRNPLLSWDDYQRVLTSRYNFASDPLDLGEGDKVGADWMQGLVKISYESSPLNVRICPTCGWTMTKAHEQVHCSSLACVTNPPDFDGLGPVPHGSLRLSKGVMRYIAKPGQLELAIASSARDLGIAYEMWPNWDRCDVLITLPSGQKLAIDAKDYCSVRALQAEIEDDNMKEMLAADEGIFVIPDETHRRHPEFVDSCNQTLKHMPGYSCTTLKKLLKRLKDSAKERAHA
ncbi:MAG: hypothetical protein Q4B54_10275 [Coriobacteriales bacterium]|nr:hypothetical protein [Coriobacteriales bacterium]